MRSPSSPVKIFDAAVLRAFPRRCVSSPDVRTAAQDRRDERFAVGAVLPGPKVKVLFRDRYKTWLRHHVGQSCEESTSHTYVSIWKNHVEAEFGRLPSALCHRWQPGVTLLPAIWEVVYLFMAVPAAYTQISGLRIGG